MSRSPDFEKPTVEAPRPCETPEELLHSRRFAEFLSYFNRSERVSGGKGIVIPDEVARSQDLAKEVLIFYFRNKALAKIDSENQKRIDHLAERAYVKVKQDYEEWLMEHPRGGRRRMREILGEDEDYDVDTPDWIVELSPDCQKTVPMSAHKELERAFQQWHSFCAEASQGEVLARRVLAMVMNNFYTLFAHRRNKILTVLRGEMGERIGTMCNGCGPKMAERTWRQFYAEIDRVLHRHGLSAKALVGMDQIQANLTLLPVFLELLNRGYKVYPDLTR
jgi:hypothetical protein